MSRLVTAGVKAGSPRTPRGETCSKGNRSVSARLRHPSVFSVLRVDGVIFIQLGTTSSEVSIPVPSQSWMRTKTLKTAVFYFMPRQTTFVYFLSTLPVHRDLGSPRTTTEDGLLTWKLKSRKNSSGQRACETKDGFVTGCERRSTVTKVGNRPVTWKIRASVPIPPFR